MDTLQLLETIRAEEASPQRLFTPDAGDVRLRASGGRQSPQYTQRLVAMVQLVGHAMGGSRRAAFELTEAMSTSDFPLLFGDTLDRMMLAEFQHRPGMWRRYLKQSQVADFRDVKRFRTSDGDQRLSLVAQGAGYPAGEIDEAQYTFSVNKYGRRFPFLWETMINDDLDAFASLPGKMARATRRTEDYFASSLYVANTTLYSTTHSVNGTNFSNKATAALALTALEAGVNAMAAFPGDANSDGLTEPIWNTPIFLVVPRQLEITAKKIVGEINFIDNTETNVLRGALEILVDPYIDIIDPTNGATSWYLFADPANGHAAEIAFLRGYAEPSMYVKSTNAVRLGAGPTEALDGDFDTDAIHYKVRHVVGGSHANAVGGWRFTYWSDGTT